MSGFDKIKTPPKTKPKKIVAKTDAFCQTAFRDIEGVMKLWELKLQKDSGIKKDLEKLLETANASAEEYGEAAENAQALIAKIQ